jgi:DNA-binding XRE family transcriptional regulator
MDTPIFVCVPKSKGAFFRVERAKLRLRQADVAVIAGSPQSYFSLSERDRYIPNWALQHLVKALGFNTDSETESGSKY